MKQPPLNPRVCLIPTRMPDADHAHRVRDALTALASIDPFVPFERHAASWSEILYRRTGGGRRITIHAENAVGTGDRGSHVQIKKIAVAAAEGDASGRTVTIVPPHTPRLPITFRDGSDTRSNDAHHSALRIGRLFAYPDETALRLVDPARSELHSHVPFDRIPAMRAVRTLLHHHAHSSICPSFLKDGYRIHMNDPDRLEMNIWNPFQEEWSQNIGRPDVLGRLPVFLTADTFEHEGGIHLTSPVYVDQGASHAPPAVDPLEAMSAIGLLTRIADAMHPGWEGKDINA